MPTIYFIAGPPGVGKSTSGASLLPDDIDILDPDRIASRYKAQGFADYKDIGNIKFNNLVKKQLFAGNDFAIELNLGFESHYDFVKSIKGFNSDNTIEVILFFTDDIKLCYQRAEQRHLEGLHYVSPETIKEMYENTMPLLHAHFSMFSSLIAVNVSGDDVPEICLKFTAADRELISAKNLPDWAEQSIKQFLELQFQPKQTQSLMQEQKQKRPRLGNRFKP